MLDIAIDATGLFLAGYVVVGFAWSVKQAWQKSFTPAFQTATEAPQVEDLEKNGMLGEVEIEPPTPILEGVIKEKSAAKVMALPAVLKVEVEPQVKRPTRREMLILAKEKKLPGYSRMSSDDLYMALRQAEHL